MVDKSRNDETVIPIPGEDNEPERRRIRKSNDHDQALEREGEHAPHNEGYDEAADGTPRPRVEHIVDEP
jgi:hypothetical protein